LMFKSIKKIKKMGLIDSQVVLHTRPVTSGNNLQVLEEMKRFCLKYKKNKKAKKTNLRALK
jgi:hypothetical protein